MPDDTPTGIPADVPADVGIAADVDAGDLGDVVAAGLPRGEAYYQVLVLFDAATAQALAEPYCALFSQVPGLSPVPWQFLHVPVARLAPETGAQSLTRVQAGVLRARLAVELAALPEFRVRFGHAHEWGPHKIACPASPPEPLRWLWEAARRAVREAAPHAPFRPGRYAGHAPIAHITGQATGTSTSPAAGPATDPDPLVPIRYWLARHDHELPDISLRVDRVHLVLARHDSARISWRRHGKPIPLAGTPGALVGDSLPAPCGVDRAGAADRRPATRGER